MNFPCAILVLFVCLTCSAAQLSQLSGTSVKISDLTSAAGYTCNGVSGSCNGCDMTVNFEFATDNDGSGSFHCNDEKAGVIGRCITCRLPSSGEGRLLNIDGAAGCEQEVANYIIDSNPGLFNSLSGFSEGRCTDVSLNSDYNLMLANGVIEVFKDQLVDPTTPVTSPPQNGNSSPQNGNSPPPKRNLGLIIGLCAAAVVLIILIVIVVMYLRKRKNEQDDIPVY